MNFWRAGQSCGKKLTFDECEVISVPRTRQSSIPEKLGDPEPAREVKVIIIYLVVKTFCAGDLCCRLCSLQLERSMGDNTPASRDRRAQGARDAPRVEAPDAERIEICRIPNGEGGSAAATRLYRRRWAIVFLFSSYSLSNAYQWIQYGIISNIIMKFYSVEAFAVDWLSMIYMLAYIPFVFPVTWILDKKGLRVTALLANALNLVGTWTKVASAQPDLFWVTVIGQGLSALAQVFLLGMPSRLASVWFGADEVSTACSIGVFGNQVS